MNEGFMKKRPKRRRVSAFEQDIDSEIRNGERSTRIVNRLTGEEGSNIAILRTREAAGALFLKAGAIRASSEAEVRCEFCSRLSA